MASNRSFHNMNFDQSPASQLNFSNLIPSHQSASPQMMQQQLPQQNIQQFMYAQQNTGMPQPQNYGLQQGTQSNTNSLVNMMTGNNNSTNNSNNNLLQTLTMPPQMQQQVQQIQQQQLLQQQQRRSYTQQQIREVQGMIEKCLTMYLTKDEVIAHLNGIEPYVIKLVWLKLEQQNPEFFHSYNIRLQIKSQIDMFNTLVKDQASLMSQQQQQLQQMNSGNGNVAVNSSTSPIRQQSLGGSQQPGSQQVQISQPTSQQVQISQQPTSQQQSANNNNTGGSQIPLMQNNGSQNNAFNSSLIYNILGNGSNTPTQQQQQSLRQQQQPSPFSMHTPTPQQQQSQPNPQQQQSSSQQQSQQQQPNMYQTQQLQEQIQRHLAQQRANQRIGSIGNNDMFNMLLNGNNPSDLSMQLQQQQQQQSNQNNQYQQSMNNSMYNQQPSGTNIAPSQQQSQYSNQNDLTANILQQQQYNQYTGPGGGNMNQNLDAQIYSGLLQNQQQVQYSNNMNGSNNNMYNNIQSYQFPNQMKSSFGQAQFPSQSQQSSQQQDDFNDLGFGNFNGNDTADLLLGLEGDANLHGTNGDGGYGSITEDFESDVNQFLRNPTRQDNPWE